MDHDLSKALIHYYNTSLSWENYSTEAMTTLRILHSAQDDNAPFMERLLYIGNYSLLTTNAIVQYTALTRYYHRVSCNVK